MIINWRISLVPAPAVIPAPVVYTNFVAVETLVVDRGDEWYCLWNRTFSAHIKAISALSDLEWDCSSCWIPPSLCGVCGVTHVTYAARQKWRRLL